MTDEERQLTKQIKQTINVTRTLFDMKVEEDAGSITRRLDAFKNDLNIKNEKNEEKNKEENEKNQEKNEEDKIVKKESYLPKVV